MATKVWFLYALVVTGISMGQSRQQVTAGTYTIPAPVNVAPGQLVTVIVHGLDDGMIKTVRAVAGTDLPMSLAGVFAGYLQVTLPNILISLPILEVHPFSPCNRVNLYECEE